MERFTPDQLKTLQRDVQSYAIAIGGLPKNHSEVFEKRGWLTPFLLGYDDLLWGRWEYWNELCMQGTIKDSGPIPQIEWARFGESGVDHTQKMLAKCLDHYEATIDNFADWLLWGLAGTSEPPKISEKLNEHFYRNFDLFLVLSYPTDYLSWLLSEATGKGYKEGLGYYPTPFTLVEMITKLSMDGEDPESLKRHTLNDPCVGCGAFLLPASNYVLRAYAMDISLIAVKLCKIQMAWYAPWFYRPADLEGFDEVAPIIQVQPNVSVETSEEVPVYRLTTSTVKKSMEGQLMLDLGI